MKKFCPNCEKETEQSFIDNMDTIEIRGELIPVHLQYYRCEECGEDYEVPQPDYDPLDEAYREYRQRKNLLQPEEIKEFRKELGLTQKEWSEVLGIGIATLNRYENGALQSEGHDQIIRLSMSPTNLIKRLEEKPDLLSEEKRERIYQQLQSNNEDGSDLLEEAIARFGNYPPDIFSGYLPFNFDKFLNVIKFFCYNVRVVKTKLNKLLFYADFRHFKGNGVSITGVRYAHATHGPVPDQFDTWLAALSEWSNEIASEEQVFGEFVGEVFVSGEPQWAIFSTSELAALSLVKDEFQRYSATQIREFSHRESGYRETKDGEFISYQFAQELQV